MGAGIMRKVQEGHWRLWKRSIILWNRIKIFTKKISIFLPSYQFFTLLFFENYVIT